MQLFTNYISSPSLKLRLYGGKEMRIGLLLGGIAVLGT